MRKALAIYSGSFNPVTKAHYEILSKAVNEVNADLGLFVRTNDAYLIKKMIVGKHDSFLLNADIRKQMLDSLNKENPKLECWNKCELGKESVDTFGTIKAVIKEYQKKGFNEFYYIMGADKTNISHWRNIETLFQTMKFIVVSRDGIDFSLVIDNDPLLSKHK